MKADFSCGQQAGITGEFMNKNYAVITALLACLLVGCGNSEDNTAKTESELSKVSSNSGRAGMPAVALKNTCDACHTIMTKKVGPAWMEVSKMYKGDPNAVAHLTVKIKKGGAGVWGTMPMPPNVTLSDADLKELIDFILGLSK
jgi:cytochrome c